MLEQSILDQLKGNLLEEKARLEADLAKLATKEGDEYETKYDQIDRDEEANADEIEQYVDNLAVTDTLEKNLKEVTEALERMEQGTYGKCANCDQDIPLARLQVYPAAKICLDCAK